MMIQRRFFQSLLFPKPTTKRHTERTIVKTNAQHLYKIIENVDEYSKFLPFCSASRILRRSGTVFDASLTVGLPPLFTEQFVSRVTSDPHDLVIETRSLKSKLFENCQSRWKLKPTECQGKTHVEFWMELTVSDPIIVVALDQVLKEVAGRQVEAFERRCQEIPYEGSSAEENGRKK
mmetsp:Transcript_24793/g.36696  ORF Transcript_24793/g.36696 Transcript_24793/m.36696 type:complete len:177 (+) Transcript_24793:94-624(+)